jgi:hypothetical protein
LAFDADIDGVELAPSRWMAACEVRTPDAERLRSGVVATDGTGDDDGGGDVVGDKELPPWPVDGRVRAGELTGEAWGDVGTDTN